MAVSTFSAPAGIQQYEQLFTSSGTWTVPAGVKTCEVTVLGGSDYGSNYGSSAGGYFRGIVDMTGATSVPVTVGSGGTVSSTKGGASSFGNYITAPGGGAGSYYKPTTQGFTPGSIAVVTGPLSVNNIYSGGYMTKDYCKLANDGRMYIYSNQNPGGTFTSIDGTTWVSSSAPIAGSTNYKIVSGGGRYIAVNTNQYATLQYSANGISYSSSNFTGSAIDGAYGPAGFLLSSGTNTMMTSPTGAVWTTLTVTGLPAAGYNVQATSSHYYAFRPNNSTAYRSTDGATWTSFALNAVTNNSNDAAGYSSYGGKVYVLNGSSTMQVVDGTTVTSVTIGTTANKFIQYNSIYIYANALGTYYSLNSPTTPVTKTEFGIPGSIGACLVTDAGIAFGTNTANSLNDFYLSRGYQGQPGFTWQSSGSYQTNGTPGVLSAGTASSSATYGYGIPGNGNEDGWGCGVGGRDGEGRSSYGSGAKYSTSGNQGVVRVRWWA